ncbi:MAG TPA: DUF4157 domain-containing protein, partial [Thermoanaerobaculia bacterium]|nr:DUF4157 domain-containing protein [Thermoanaerobaculia bacterium]
MKEQTLTPTSSVAAPNDKPLLLQRKCGCGDKCGDCEKKKDEKKNVLQRFGGDRTPAPDIPQSVHGVLRAPGRPLDSATRARMEPRFGFDFSRVRIHADDSAHSSAKEVGALAYTVGHDVAFSSGHFRPGTSAGDSLLAHELAHVVQQSGEGTSSSNSALEADADRSAATLTKSADEDASPRLRAATRLSLQPDPGKSKGSGAADSKTETKTPDDAQAKTPPKQSATTPPPPTPPAPPPNAPSFELAGKEKKRWRVSFKTKPEADNQRQHVKSLHVKADELIQVSGQWTFDYYPLTKAEADAEQKTKAKAFPKYDVTVHEDSRAKTHYLRVLRKCPEGIDPKGAFKIWEACFDTEAKAKALVKQFKDAHADAETVKAEETRWGVYYKPLTEPEAAKAGAAAAKARTGSETGIYQVETEEKKQLKTFTYNVKTECPKGFKDLGSDWLITAYFLPNEKDYPAEPLVEAKGIPKKKFREKFLFSEGVRMEGTGRTLDGSLIAFDGDDEHDHFTTTSKVFTKSGTEATAGRTVAVDKKVISLGAALII